MLVWLALVLALIIGLVKLLMEGKSYEISVLYVVLSWFIGAILAIAFDFLGAVVASETFAIDLVTLLGYLLAAFIGAVVVPIAAWLSRIKVE